VRKLKAGEELFPGIQGYEDSVVPQIVNAVLARHDFILLGLRGQAKSRILRQLVSLLDEHIPDSGRERGERRPAPADLEVRAAPGGEHGDETPIEWVDREHRYVEKLATPDVTIADIIGDVDPIKAARGGHILADELTIHYGLLPRANRGLFAINELPDLAGKIQVGLFNILQEGDVQVKGYPIRLALDVFMVFTANPEDYTARGKIITPLKDRIGAEIRTHYPGGARDRHLDHRPGGVDRRDDLPVEIPDFVAETVERVAFLARKDKRIDQRSGVSQRMPITVMETVVSNAERRALRHGEDVAVPRMTDLYAALPAITGKMELEYEGELHGADKIARELIQLGSSQAFDVRAAGAEVGSIVDYFEGGGALQVGEDSASAACVKGFGTVPGLLGLVESVGLAEVGERVGRATARARRRAAPCELVGRLEALVAQIQGVRISRSSSGGYTYVRSVRTARSTRAAVPPIPGVQGVTIRGRDLELPLVGRKDDLERLYRIFGHETRVEPMILLAGDPGVGKSRMVRPSHRKRPVEAGQWRRAGRTPWNPGCPTTCSRTRSSPS
jgi:magnesium chelatase subunit I